MSKLMPCLLVGFGGFLGANARFLLAAWVGSAYGARFPLGTFIINISGSCLLGLMAGLLAHRLVANPDQVRQFFGIGFMGAYTTFSTFSFETHSLLEDGEWMSAMVNLIVSPLAGLLAVHLGMMLARKWF